MSQVEGSFVIGVDLGGTRLRTALADRQGAIIRQRSIATNADEGRDAVIRRIVSEIRAVLVPEPISSLRAVAVAVPGPCNPSLGVVYNPPNLPGWGEVALSSILAQDLSVPVHLGNDANVAALAEHQFGSGRGLSCVVYLTVSTGIGGGVVEADRLILGAWGGAAEIGHITIDLNGPLCGCGNHGCLESMASGTAIASETARRLGAGERSSLIEQAGVDLNDLRADQIVAAADDGDPLSRRVIDWAGYNLGVGLANIMHLYDPAIIIVGGGVSNAWPLLEPAIHRAIRERAMAAYVQHTRVVRSQLGDDVGLLGAVSLALRLAR